MGKVIVSQFVTVDGVVEDPGGSESSPHGGWAFKYERGEEGDKFNGMPKYVVSSTLESPEWNNTTVVGTDLPAAVERIKSEVDGDILVNGSVQLVRAMIDLGLVDELRLMIFPTVIGGGLRLFGDGGRTQPLRLAEARQAGETLITVYEPTGGS